MVSVGWRSFGSSLSAGLSGFRQSGEFVDVSLACEGQVVGAHRVVLAAASPFLKSLVQSSPCKHPVLYLNNVSFGALKALVEYVYTGETAVAEDQLPAFLALAADLRIQGLDEIAPPPPPPPPPSPPPPLQPSSTHPQYTLSSRGSLQLILNRYMYNLFSKSQRGCMRRWRCIDYRDRKCPACCITQGNAVVRRTNMHIHPFHDKKILAKVHKRAVYSAIAPLQTQKDVHQ